MPDLCPVNYDEVHDQRFCRSFCFGSGCKYLRECRTYPTLPNPSVVVFKGDIKKLRQEYEKEELVEAEEDYDLKG